MNRLVIYNKANLSDPKANEKLLKESSEEYDQILEERGKAPYMMKPILMSAASFGGTIQERQSKQQTFQSILQAILKRYPSTQAVPFNFNVKMLVVGMPNVGKSTIINNLKAYGLREPYSPLKLKQSVKVGALPGVTKSISGLIKINQDPKIYVYDSPGIMTPNITDPERAFKLALTGAMKEGIVDDIALADYLLYVLNRKEGQPLAKYYQLKEPIDEIYAFLYHVTIVENFKPLKNSGNDPDFLRAARYIIALFRKGKFGLITLDTF